MKVQDVLAAKGSTVVTVKPADTIATLSEVLHAKRIGAAVVSNNGETIDGVISERDLAYGIGRHGAKLAQMPVSALMTEKVFTCTPDDPIGRVASMMLSRNVRHLPVEKDGRLVGIVSIRDVLKVRVEELQQRSALLNSLANKSDRPQQDRE